jgi:trk system potassium uptake protein TrkH
MMLVAGFAGVIVLGTLLLMLPFSTTSGQPAPLSTALFTSTSAVCVTGLAVVDTGTYWSRFGQTVIALLVLLGGIGFGAAATLLFWAIGRNIGLSDRLMLQQMLPHTGHGGQVVRTSIYIVSVSLLIVAGGSVVLFPGWAARYPVGEAAYLAIFHSISAFCNAGFDLFGALEGPGVSLATDRHNPFTILPIAMLVLVGGLGFPVIGELASWRPRRPYHLTRSDSQARPRPPLSLHARLVLVAHLGLFVLGIILFWWIEGRNPSTLGGQPPGGQIVDAVNTSIYPRSAGFSTIPLTAFDPTSLLLMLMLMFVGTGSAGTGGGVKVNTIATLFASVAATVQGRPRPELFKRTLTQESINKALVVVVISASVIAAATFALTVTEPQISVERLLFEVVSAFSTVGLSLDVTARLSEAGRVIIELMMFAGRLGPLTLVVLLSAREQAPRLVYVEEPVLVG